LVAITGADVADGRTVELAVWVIVLVGSGVKVILGIKVSVRVLVIVGLAVSVCMAFA
jgi:hypothetical protein